jgi:drug/metabolite transporter (DMT)-like permease
VKTEYTDASIAHVRRQSFLLALAGFSMFSLGDGITKSTAGLWPGIAVAALRFGIAAAGLGLILLIRQGTRGFAMPRPWVQIGRGVAMTVSTGCIFMAFQVMPLATATAIAFTTPLLTALLSALLLREHVHPRIWATIFVAFVGVILVLRPNFAALGLFVLLPVGSALAMAVLMILNRAAASLTEPLLSQFLVAALATPMLALLAAAGHLSGDPAFHIGMPSWSLVARTAVLATTATIGHWLVYLATVRASAATIAPANYVQILFAVTIGWIVFGDMPDRLTFAGIALIIGAGAWLLRNPPVRR